VKKSSIATLALFALFASRRTHRREHFTCIHVPRPLLPLSQLHLFLPVLVPVSAFFERQRLEASPFMIHLITGGVEVYKIMLASVHFSLVFA